MSVGVHKDKPTKKSTALISVNLTSTCLILFVILASSGFERTDAASKNDFRKGVVVSHSNRLELVDPENGEVWSSSGALTGPEGGDLTGLAVTNATPNTITALAVEMVNDTNSRLIKVVLAGQDNKNEVQTILSDLSHVDSLAYDSSSSKVYLKSSSSQQGSPATSKLVEYSIKEAKMEEMAFNNSTDEIHGLVVDSCRSDVFWISVSLGDGRSWLSRRDDRGVTSRVTDLPVSESRHLTRNNLAIAGSGQRKIYWITKTEGAIYLERLDLQTLGHEVICSYSGPTSIYSISADEKSVYWSDWRQQAVLKVDLTSSSEDSECRPQVVRKLHTRPMGVASVAGSILFDRSKCTTELPVYTPAPTTQASTPATLTNSSDTSITDTCHNYCIHHDLSDSDYETHDLVRFEATCVVSPDMGEPYCMCQSGIRGSRCEVDPCQSFCLNGGRCVRATDTESEPQCKCQPGMGGQRCDAAASQSTNDPTFLYPFALSLTVLAVISCVATFLAAHNRKLRRSLIKATSSPTVPDVVKKSPRTRVFSSSSNRSKSRSKNRDNASNGGYSSVVFDDDGDYDRQQRHLPSEDKVGLNDGGGVSSGNNSKKSSGCNGVSKEGVVVDLGDCCQMTLCNTPCVQAQFRKPTHRKSRASRPLSVSNLENGACTSNGSQREDYLNQNNNHDDRQNLISDW